MPSARQAAPLDFLAAALIALLLAHAIEPPVARAADTRIRTTITDADLDEGQRTKARLYLSAREAADLVAAHPDMVLIDVRDPATVAEKGLPAAVTRNIPLYFRYLHLRGTIDEIEVWEPNRRFAADVLRLLADVRAQKKGATVILMCWKGAYSARAADALADAGLENVYSVIVGTGGDMRGGAFLQRYPGWRALGRGWLGRPRPSQLYVAPE